ncbi:MAG: SGNH/GDSL hydrolase family protein [Eubacteriales bacterium]|nr:SGNH/GDSL hydrolase family protein [Eubacteriales bacterium]
MRILMLGNSYTFVNDLPSMIAQITGAEVVNHTRGGARLSEQLNPVTRMGALTIEALEKEKWDYVVLQEMSNAAIKFKKSFRKSVTALCEKIRQAGATPVLYATWAYKDGSVPMEKMGMTYEEMERQMYQSFHEVGDKNGMLIADVGRAFFEKNKEINLYHDDGSHPNMEGSKLAAEIIAKVIMGHAWERE